MGSSKNKSFMKKLFEVNQNIFDSNRAFNKNILFLWGGGRTQWAERKLTVHRAYVCH